ncbi:hypothetical protein [Methanobrevibacter sp.]
MNAMNSSTMNIKKSEEIENIDIDHLISDVLIIKAESVKDNKIFNYADYLEKQLLKIKRKQAKLEY